ncbi:MAG: rhodanese-like domain-containing protein [Pseudomonadota bacterium]
MNEFIEFAGNHPLLVAAAAVLTVLVIANEIRMRAAGSLQLAPNLAVQLINRGAVVLDVRGPEQFAGGHIVGSRNVPQSDVEAWGKKTKTLTKKAIIMVDDNGVQAARSAADLRKLEYTTVFSLAGGLTAWRTDNLPLETGDGKSGGAKGPGKNQGKKKNKNRKKRQSGDTAGGAQ